MSEIDALSIIKSEFAKLVRSDFDGDLENTPLAELGVDSLEFYETLMFLEDEYGIEIPIEELDSGVALSDILKSINSGTK